MLMRRWFVNPRNYVRKGDQDQERRASSRYLNTVLGMRWSALDKRQQSRHFAVNSCRLSTNIAAAIYEPNSFTGLGLSNWLLFDYQFVELSSVYLPNSYKSLPFSQYARVANSGCGSTAPKMGSKLGSIEPSRETLSIALSGRPSNDRIREISN